MRRAFADTSFYVAVLAPDDAHHRAAAELAANPALRVVTTDFVLLELANFLSEPPHRARLPRLIDALASSRTTRVLPASRTLFRKGLSLFRARSDKAWSLTDCTSMVVMTELGLHEALTADGHFEQAGFRAVLA